MFGSREELPVFTAEEVAVIKLVYPEIVKRIENPHKYFIDSVSITDDSIVVELLSLSHLVHVVVGGDITVWCTKSGEVTKVYVGE